MKVALALATVVAGQYVAPGPYGVPAYGAPAPVYGRPIYGGRPAYGRPIYGQPIYGAPQAGVPQAGPSDFELDQALLAARAEIDNANGNRVFFNFPVTSGIVPGYASLNKARAQQVLLRRNRRAQNYLKATADGDIQDQNKLDDLRLQNDAIRNQVQRRKGEFFPGPISAVYEGRSHQALLQLARNQRDDAERAMAANPSQENWLKLKAARDAIEAREQWLDANKADVFGFGTPFGVIGGPIKRWQASDTALDSARRQWRVVRDKYDADPSEDNWWEVRLQDIKLQALEANKEANEGETVQGASILSQNFAGIVYGRLHMNNQFSDEADLWKRYQRLSLQNLRRKRAQAASGVAANANPAEAQLLALDTYGGANGRSGTGNRN